MAGNAFFMHADCRLTFLFFFYEAGLLFHAKSNEIPQLNAIVTLVVNIFILLVE